MSTRNARSVRSRLVRKLADYSAVAMSATAVCGEAEGAVVYTDLGAGGMPFADLSIDLNLDGRSEVAFRSFLNGTDSGGLNLYGLYGNGVTGRKVAGSTITSGQGFGSYITVDAVAWGCCSDDHIFGEFRGSNHCSFTTYGNNYQCHAERLDGFVGVKFNSDGQTHLGWIDIRLGSGYGVYGFAYETEPGVPIVAGDTGLLIGGHGDTDRDGDVDLDDLNNVRNQFGQQGAEILGDDDRDGDVDLDDLNSVRNNFGATGGTNPVPEPPSLLLLAAGAAGLAALRAKRNRFADTES